MRQTKKIRGKTAFIFTPLLHETEQRVTMWIREPGTPRGEYTWFMVTDAITGKEYKARTIDCALPGCICDAEIFGYEK